MGPIIDELGLEQGGISSSDWYKIYNNEQLIDTHETDFGVSIYNIHVASVGQADDTALLSHDLHQLNLLLQITLQYCQKHHVQLSPGKTKLQVFLPKEFQKDLLYYENTSPIAINKI